MNFSFWVGTIGGIVLVRWGIANAGFSSASGSDLRGLVVVVGGLAAAMLINCSFSQLVSAAVRFGSLFMPVRLPSAEDAIAEIVRLSRKAQREGGILSLQNDAREIADGFLHRAITVAIASGESAETRRMMEAEVKNLRINRQEDANVFRTMGVLSPMFGLLGTLLGMINVLESMSDPTKASAAMALALSSAFLGIGFANFVCVPVSGQIRLLSMKETMILEILLEGVLDIAAGKAPYVVELHLASYSQARRRALETGATGGGAGGNPAPAETGPA